MPALATTATDHALGAELEHRVAGLWWLLSREHPTELSRSAASVLATLRGEGAQRVTALAQLESLSQPGMSVLLQRLEKRALVVRQPDPEDGRATRIAITDAGLAALHERAAGRAAFLAERLSRLAPDERDALAAALPALDALLALEITT